MKKTLRCFSASWSQCYNHFTGLYLQVLSISKLPFFVQENLVLKSENKHQHFEFDYTWGYN